MVVLGAKEGVLRWLVVRYRSGIAELWVLSVKDNVESGVAEVRDPLFNGVQRERHGLVGRLVEAPDFLGPSIPSLLQGVVFR